MFYLSIIDDEDDKVAFRYIYDNYKKRLHYIAFNILRDDYLSEDVVSETFIRIAKNIKTVLNIDETKRKAYIFSICHNIAIDFYRKRNKEQLYPLEYSNLYIPDVADSYIDEKTFGDTEKIVLQLPAEYGAILALKYSQGLSNKQIAEALDITEINVRKRLSRAKTMLSEKLKKEVIVSG